MNRQLKQFTEIACLQMRVQRRSPIWMVSLAAAVLLGYTEAFTLGVNDWPTMTQACRAYQLGCVMIFGVMTFLLTAGALSRDLSDRHRDLLLCRPISPRVYVGGVYAGNCLFALCVSLCYMMAFLAVPLLFGQSTLYTLQPFVYVTCFSTLPTILFCGALAMGQEVERALRQTIAQQRGLDDEAATRFVAGLRRERRLLKDLY